MLLFMTSPEPAPELAPEPITTQTPPAVPRYYSQLKKAHKERVVPELKEEDLEETFVRGARTFVLVPYLSLMHTLVGHRKWPRRSIREQDGKQCAASAQADRDTSFVPGNSFSEAESAVGKENIA